MLLSEWHHLIIISFYFAGSNVNQNVDHEVLNKAVRSGNWNAVEVPYIIICLKDLNLVI
jgi:hypothetical protein